MLKTCATKLIYALASKDSVALQRVIDGAQTISFDVFDTLIKRDVVRPTEVFAMLEKQFALSGEITLTNFASLRIQAEQKAHAAHPGREVTLEEIYRQLPLTEQDRTAVMEAECAMELAVSTPSIPMKQVYDACIRQGKKVLFISDMYLPAECIEAILRKNGYTDGKLYVSSRVGVTKRSGELFQRVAQAEVIKLKTWLHIGDSISSDWLIPKKLGMRSALVRRDLRNSPYVDRKIAKTNEAYRRLNHFISTRIDRYTDPYERIGYAVLGPLLYGFARWLEENVPEDEMMVFLARDAAIMQRAFSAISTRPSIYFYTSRNAIRLPCVYHTKSMEAIPKQETGMRVPSLRELASRYSLTEAETAAVAQKCGMTAASPVGSEAEKQKVLQAIWPFVQIQAQEQYELMQKYLLQEKFPQQCALVDIGWNGTIQKLLTRCEFTGAEGLITWSGFYLGAFETEKDPRYQSLSRKQFLFEKNVNGRIYESVKYSRFFFELLFMASHGSTKGYCRNKEGEIEPKMGEPDNLGEMNDKINRLQNAALRFAEDIVGSPLHMVLMLDAQATAGGYVALARVPTKETLSLFKSCEYEDGRICRFVSMHRLGYYVFHWKAFYREFVESPCKSWFLKSVFRIPLPYIRMLKIMRKITLND